MQATLQMEKGGLTGDHMLASAYPQDKEDWGQEGLWTGLFRSPILMKVRIYFENCVHASVKIDYFYLQAFKLIFVGPGSTLSSNSCPTTRSNISHCASRKVIGRMITYAFVQVSIFPPFLR